MCKDCLELTEILGPQAAKVDKELLEQEDSLGQQEQRDLEAVLARWDHRDHKVREVQQV